MLNQFEKIIYTNDEFSNNLDFFYQYHIKISKHPIIKTIDFLFLKDKNIIRLNGELRVQ